MATTGSVYQRGTRSLTQAHPHEYPPTGVAAAAGCAGALRAGSFVDTYPHVCAHDDT